MTLVLDYQPPYPITDAGLSLTISTFTNAIKGLLVGVRLIAESVVGSTPGTANSAIRHRYGRRRPSSVSATELSQFTSLCGYYMAGTT